MWITPLPPIAFRSGEGVTWLSSQWKLRTYPAHFSVEINTIRSLAEGETDIAIGLFAKAGEGSQRQPLYTQGYGVVVRSGHPIEHAADRLSAFLDARHIIVSQDGGVSGMVDRACAKRGLCRRVVVAMPYFLSAMTTVAESDLVCTLPLALVGSTAKRLRLKVLEPPLDLPSLTISAIWRTDRNRTALKAWVLGQLQKCAERLRGSVDG